MRRIPWKVVGLAGVAGVAATGAVVVARQRRSSRDYEPDELRERLRERLAAVPPLNDDGAAGEQPQGPAKPG